MERLSVSGKFKAQYFEFSAIKFPITSRSSTSRCAPWTVFKLQFCGFAAQKYSTKPQLKNCRLAQR
jgi:hypothetical protein